MSFLTARRLGVAVLVALTAACSSSGDDSVSLVTVSQDLSVDPSGLTTVLTFAGNVNTGLGASNFTSSGGQTPTTVAIVGTDVTITWNDRVTPAHTVSAVNAGKFNATNRPVTSTDTSVPTFTATGTQVPGVGGDTMTVTFSGPRVVEAFAEDATNWTLTNGGEVMDLTGSVFSLDTASQVMTVTLGTEADVFASFDLAPTSSVVSVSDVALSTIAVVGSATGDSTAPTLVSVVQNLDSGDGGDEFGTVVDLTFSEPMSPVFSSISNNFGSVFPTFATAATPVSGSPEMVRVTFSGPVVPSIDTVAFANLVDTHGNPIANQSAVAVVADGTIASNAFTTDPTVTTVTNVGGDVIQAVFDFPLDPDSASVVGNWFLESPDGTPVDISGASYDYVEATKTLTVTLANDVVNANSFEFGAAVGNEPRNIDGTDFTTTFVGTVSGETTEPTVTSVEQNRTIDPDGLTFDVTFSEDVDPTTSQTVGNYGFSSGSSVQSATLQPTGDLVRVVLDIIAVPGEHTFDVMNVADLAGNVITTASMVSMSSSDVTVPVATNPEVEALSGADNDTIVVTFNDTMFTSEVTDVSNWAVESPVGSSLDTTNASIAYDQGSGIATLTFDGGDDVNFQTGSDYQVTLSTMRDIGGNVVDGTPITGDVLAESVLPVLESVWFEDVPNNNVVHVRFSEATTQFSDLISGLTEYVPRDGGGTIVTGSPPSVVVDADGRGAALTYGVGMSAGFTLDVRGITDLAGNQMVPVDLVPMETASTNEPVLSSGGSDPLGLSVAGEDNDRLTVTFDEDVSRLGLFDPANWTLTDGSTTADFAVANFSFDGSNVVTIDFDAPGAFNFDGGAYTLTVDNLVSAQGVEMSSSSAQSVVMDGASDATEALAGLTRLDANAATDVLVEFVEAVDSTEAVNVANYQLGGSTPATAATAVGLRTVKVTYGATVTTTDTIDVTVSDLAGNSATVTHAIAVADTNGPVLNSVQGVSVAGVGNDRIEMVYNAPINLAAGLQLSNYTITEAGNPISLGTSTAIWNSTTNTVTIHLDDSIDLGIGNAINVIATGITNHALITMNPSANVNGTVTGDSTAPDFSVGYVNFRADAAGTIVDLYFDEDVDESFVALTSSYVVSGGQSVTSVEVLAKDHVRLTLSAALGVAETITMTGLSDVAGNVSGSIVATPLF